MIKVVRSYLTHSLARRCTLEARSVPSHRSVGMHGEVMEFFPRGNEDARVHFEELVKSCGSRFLRTDPEEIGETPPNPKKPCAKEP
jgi:hypothetical protein